jgi:hypothetical protein
MELKLRVAIGVLFSILFLSCVTFLFTRFTGNMLVFVHNKRNVLTHHMQLGMSRSNQAFSTK